MNLRSKTFFLFIVFILVLFFRFCQTQRDFQEQLRVFPRTSKGLLKLWVAEEPTVLFDHSPQSHDTGRLGGVYQPFVKDVRVVCEVIAFNGTPIPPVKARCTFRLSPGESRTLLFYGEILEAEGKVDRPSSAMNPGQFDYAHYLETKGVAYVLYAAAGKWRKILPVPPLTKEGSKGDLPHGSTFLRWSYALKREAEDRLYRYLSYPQNALLDGILLGERASLPDDVVESFFLTGTIHILAVSGMITAFVAGLFFMVFRVLRFNSKWAAVPSFVALLFFIFMTGANPPVCRAGLFSSLALLAIIFERRIHGGVLLLTTAGVLILINPLLVADLSFQISFLATAGLMAMSPWFMEKLSFLPRPAAFLITASSAAQLAVWCLIIYDFNQFSFYSVLANLFIVPLALFSTAAGLTLLAGSLLHPSLGALFGAACVGPLKLLVLIADVMARWPKAEWIIASPPLAWVLCFHVLLLAAFYFFWPRLKPEEPSAAWKEQRAFLLKGRRWMTRLGMVFVLAAFSTFLIQKFSPHPLRLTFLAVGHGNAVVLESPQGRVFIVDGGKEIRGPDRYLQVVTYLRYKGIQKVDGILNTHPDEDHVGGLVNVLSAYLVAEAYEASQTRSTSQIYQFFKASLQQKGIPVHPLKEDDSVDRLAPVRLDILHPGEKFHPGIHEDNNRSVVSLVSFGGIQVMLPGDLEKAGLVELLRNHQPFPKVDWLMAPHHGRNSGEPALCESGFHPRFVVVSDWRDYPRARALYEAGGLRSFQPRSTAPLRWRSTGTGLADTELIRRRIGKIFPLLVRAAYFGRGVDFVLDKTL